MENDLVELCSDKTAHSEFKRVFGERPKDETKVKEWEDKRTAYFIAWEAGRKSLLKEIQEYYGTESSIWSMCEDCESTVDGHKIRIDSGGYDYEFGSKIYPENELIVINLEDSHGK